MAEFKLVLMHAERDTEGVHLFTAADDLMTHSPLTVLRTTMAAMETEMKGLSIGHLDFEIYSCLKDAEKEVVSALGDLIFEGGQRQPFCALVSRA